VRTAGIVIRRQRPGTAKGFIFLSTKDETGIANSIITPDLYDQDRLTVTRSKFLLVEGFLQNLDDVVNVKATRLIPLSNNGLEPSSHDFHWFMPSPTRVTAERSLLQPVSMAELDN
jgi:error-prone DNA polymerase